MHCSIPSNNKKASVDKCTFGVQIIKQTLTLTKMTLSKPGRWKLVELRSATMPISWELRGQWVPLFKMLTTMYVELLEQKKDWKS